MAVRKIAREARWQQQVEESEQPDGNLESPRQEGSLDEIKQRREKADK